MSGCLTVKYVMHWYNLLEEEAKKARVGSETTTENVIQKEEKEHGHIQDRRRSFLHR